MRGPELPEATPEGSEAVLSMHGETLRSAPLPLLRKADVRDGDPLMQVLSDEGPTEAARGEERSMNDDMREPEAEGRTVRLLTYLVLLILAAVAFGWAVSQIPSDQTGVPSPAPVESER